MATLSIKEKLHELDNEVIIQQYEYGRLCDKDINVMWSYLQRHTNAFCVSGRNKSDFLMEMKTCCNPHLKKFWQNVIEDWDSKSVKSISQNEENFERLEVIEREACGVGIRRLRHILNNMVRKTHDKDSHIILTLIDLEYANLKAKLHVGEIRSRIYDRKEWLMEKLSWLLKNSGWNYGITEATGKNAAYCLYVYLPNGKQVSFHTTNWQFYKFFPAITCKWDGQRASTMTKLVDYINELNIIN